MGTEQGETRCLKFLGRTITLTDEGIEWEGDPKHVAAYIEKLKDFAAVPDSSVGGMLQEGSSCGMRGVKTPGVKKQNEEEARIILSVALSKSYRGLAALANFISQDRADTSFASKEVSKTMSAPAECDIVAV